MSNATAPHTLDLIAAAQRVDTPAAGFRVSRCQACGVAVTWKGAAARPGCPICGEVLSTTTRRLRAQFVVLEGDLLTHAELTAGGLEDAAKWEDDDAARLRATADRAEAGVVAGERELDADGTVWTMRDAYDFEVARGITGRRRSTGVHPGRLRDAAAKADAKAAKHRRRAAKLEAGA